MAKIPAITKEPKGHPLPIKIKLTCPYGFMDDAGVKHMWAANQEITNPEEIKTLINGGAEHVDLE